MVVVLGFEKPFNGRVFVKGHSGKPECSSGIVSLKNKPIGQALNSSVSLQAVIDHKMCDTEKIRMVANK